MNFPPLLPSPRLPDSQAALVYYSSSALSILFIRFSPTFDRSGIRFVRSIYLGQFALYAPRRVFGTNEHADGPVLPWKTKRARFCFGREKEKGTGRTAEEAGYARKLHSRLELMDFSRKVSQRSI